jgi:hypothetical protein
VAVKLISNSKGRTQIEVVLELVMRRIFETERKE